MSFLREAVLTFFQMCDAKGKADQMTAVIVLSPCSRETFNWVEKYTTTGSQPGAWRSILKGKKVVEQDLKWARARLYIRFRKVGPSFSFDRYNPPSSSRWRAGESDLYLSADNLISAIGIFCSSSSLMKEILKSILFWLTKMSETGDSVTWGETREYSLSNLRPQFRDWELGILDPILKLVWKMFSVGDML